MMITDELILSALTTEGATSLEVWKKIGQWSDNSIRIHLVRMSDAGTIERYKQPIPSGFQWMYRRKRTPADIAEAAIYHGDIDGDGESV